MKRRTKLEMEMMREEVTSYLNRTDNNAHQAHELMIKEKLEAGHLIGYWIRGIKDFEKVAKEIQDNNDKFEKEYNKQQSIKAMKEASKEEALQFINSFNKNNIMSLYKSVKNSVSNNDKLNLIYIVSCISHDEQIELNESEINTLKRIVKLFNNDKVAI